MNANIFTIKNQSNNNRIWFKLKSHKRKKKKEKEEKKLPLSFKLAFCIMEKITRIYQMKSMFNN
jgi:hypothetical protein